MSNKSEILTHNKRQHIMRKYYGAENSTTNEQLSNKGYLMSITPELDFNVIVNNRKQYHDMLEEQFKKEILDIINKYYNVKDNFSEHTKELFNNAYLITI